MRFGIFCFAPLLLDIYLPFPVSPLLRVSFFNSEYMFMKKFLIIIAVVIFSAAAVFAQTGVKGKVKNNKGKGISNATITARQDGRDVKSVQSDSKGSFILEGLKSGVYNLVFEAPGYGAGLLSNVEIQAGKIRELSDRLILSPDKGTFVIVMGSVFNQDGRSVTGAKIEAEKVFSDGSTKKIGSYYSNSAGEFSFRQPEGAAKIRVTASLKGAKISKEVEVEMAAIYRLALTLDFTKVN